MDLLIYALCCILSDKRLALRLIPCNKTRLVWVIGVLFGLSVKIACRLKVRMHPNGILQFGQS